MYSVYSNDDQGRVYQNSDEPRGVDSDGHIRHYSDYVVCIFYSINIKHTDCYCVKGL